MIPARMGTLERSRGRIEHAIAELGYATWYDPVGTLGVVCALEVARLAAEEGLDVPLRVLSFLEEEGSGFDSGLLGSRSGWWTRSRG